MRKLARIEKIREINPIKNADAIEVATVQSWKVVAEKNLHQPGDEVIYCEIDSLLPIRPEFEFLRKSSYKKLENGTEGFRLRTVKLRGQVSQGLLLPKKILGDRANEFTVGDEVTELLGIIKYEPPIPACLSGQIRGLFPSFIPKTDEERIQNLTDQYDEFKKHIFYVTEKLDGTSATFFLNNGDFGVCSRGLDLVEDLNNSFWKVARELQIEEKLRNLGRNLSLQGELIGEGIQSNLYKLKGQHFRIFNVFDIDKYEYLSYKEFIDLSNELKLTVVPIIDEEFNLPETIEQLLAYADAKSKLNLDQDREGVVIRTKGENRVSFKVISNKFLEKHE